MAQIAIQATKREVVGKPVKNLRKAGKLPAVLYGFNTANTQIEIDLKEFISAFKSAGESTVVNLVVDGKTFPVLIHEVQNHYLNDRPIHVDFYAVNMTEKVKVHVPLRFIGESAAVKALGGTLVKSLSEVEVECLPADLPNHLEVDISSLNTFEDAIRLSDLKIPGKVELAGSKEEVIVTVAAPRTEEEMKSLEEKVTEDVTKVEGVVKPEAPVEGAEGEVKEAKEAKKETKKEEK